MAAAHHTPPVTTRGLRSTGDYEAMAAVLAASREADGDDETRTAAQLEAWVAAYAGFDPAEGVRIAEIDGEVVGYSFGALEGDHPELGRILVHNGSVHPQWRGRGAGRRLLAEAQLAAANHAARRPGRPPATTTLRTFVSEADRDSRRLLEHDGYEIARYGFTMVRPTLDDPPPVTLPAGIELRQAAGADRPAIGHAMNEAFADHWGVPAYPDEEMEALLEHPLFGQVDVWQVAWDGDRPVGGVLGFINEQENDLLGRRRGYTENIWTVREWRGRGIATALIGANLRFLAARGMTEAALTVDAQSLTGALALYEKVGFERRRTSLVYQRRG